ncbi:hypothetical protein SUGI_0615950 [Cryptomeria japonica]|uniref:uncharacterized protein LOC131031510 n=1 Tax=Cryptomeria japonica TaxID=3369 RepID=UPI0024147C67|nr:uncharacterized protein LOC131031510 [Cryptomeria japonica]GLJ30923.1 hypothetical protein SUGI_0615950 [Cryptomeria japonica]
MPSGAKRRKAAKKKKEKEIGLHVQTSSQPLQEDSGNEHNHDYDHESVNEDDVGTPKSYVQINEGEEKGEGGSPVQQKENHGEGRENPPKTSGFDMTRSNSSAVPENGLERVNEPEVLFSEVLHDDDVLVRNMGPLNDKEEGHPKGTSDGDEIYSGEIETRTDVGLIGFNFRSGVDDESEVSSFKQLPNENESNQTTDVRDNSPKDVTQVDLRSPSPELESSDGDESKLDIASTLAVFDTNDSIQSLGSVESPGSSQSISSQMFTDQTSNDGTAFMSQDKEGVSEGISETLFQDLSSESESADTQHSKFNQEEDENESYLYPDVIEGFQNDENILILEEVVSDNCVAVVEELSESVSNCENIQGSELISSGIASKESEAITEVEENIVKSLDVPLPKLESSTVKDTVVMSIDKKAREDLVSTSGDLISTCGEASREAIGDLISTVGVANSTVIPTREAIRDVMSTGEASGDMGSTSREASGDLVSTNGKCSGHVVLTSGEFSGDEVSNAREVHGDVASNNRESFPDVASTGVEASREVMGSSHSEGTSVDSKETSNPKLHPQNGENENATLLQRKSRTSWLNCCGILELFTSSQS